MNWLTTIWTSFITLALALSGVYVVMWLRRREWLYLLFVLFGVSIATQAATEVWMFRATTIEEYGLALRWFHVPVFISFCATVGIIHLSFNSDRLWLGIAACGLRFVSVVVNFVQDPNVNYVALTRIDTIAVLGEQVATVEGESSPWMLTGQLALITLLVYVLDAGFSVWRRDRSLRAVLFCAALALLVLIGALQGILVFWGLVPTPMLAAPVFIGIALVMGIEVWLHFQRAEQLEDMLQKSKVQLEQVSHSAAMSELSGALAHEINQPLGIILSNAEAASIILESEHPDMDELQDIVGDIISADQRAADVIIRLRSLLQRGDPDLQDCDLNNVIAEAIGHLANDFQARNIELQRSGDRELPLIHADGILLVQVVLNLLGNARDAVSQNPEGQRIVNISSSANEEDIVITIEDNGAGVTGDPERIFDPFVTSKKSGMGMGLAISKSIIEAHGGKISCKSTVGSGTVFKVSIPQKSAMS